MAEIDEASLVRRAKEGDTRAFDELVGLYGRTVYNLALRMVGNREDARDLTQSTFLKAWRGLGSFETSRRFFSWLYRIALNESLSFLRNRRGGEALDERAEDPAPTPEDDLRASERCDTVQAALMRLSEGERQILVLHYYGQLSYAELSELLDVHEKTVKSRLFTARRALGEILRRWGFESDETG